MEASKKNVPKSVTVAIFAIAVAIAGAYALSRYSYDIYHFVAELFSIIIGVSIFIIAWNTRKITDNKFLLFVGISLLFVAVVDLAHALSYKGMELIPHINESNVATQLWVAARYMQAASLLFALIFVWGRRKINSTVVISLFSIATALVFTSVFYWKNFPACFVDGQGLTTFKITSEYIIVAMLLASVAILYSRRNQIDKMVWLLLIFSFIISSASEFAFTKYISVFGLENFIGHILKIIAFYLFYQALIAIVLNKPFDTMFFELSQSHSSLKKAKTALEASEANLKYERDQTQIYLQSIGKGVVAIDRQWNITLWNAEITAMSGYSSDEVMGKDLRGTLKLIKEYDRRKNLSYIEDAMTLHRTVDLVDKTLLINKNGEEVPVGGSAAPILSKKGDVKGAIIIIRDVAVEREMAVMRSDFTYASHQLRTPVTQAMWQLEAVLRSKDSKQIKEGAKEAYRALMSVNKLSSKLADVSEIDQEPTIVKTDSVKLANFCADVIGEAKKLYKEYDVEVTLMPVAPTELILTNARLLKRALLEVIENGIIYSSAKSKVVLSVTRSKESYIFAVADSGIGIEPGQEPVIFTKFFRGSNFDTSAIAGAGLGLYIAESYIKMLKGKIWFRSRPNKGTTFFLSVPASTK